MTSNPRGNEIPILADPQGWETAMYGPGPMEREGSRYYLSLGRVRIPWWVYRLVDRLIDRLDGDGGT